MWEEAASIVNKQLRTADKRLSSSFSDWANGYKLLALKTNHIMIRLKKPRNWAGVSGQFAGALALKNAMNFLLAFQEEVYSMNVVIYIRVSMHL